MKLYAARKYHMGESKDVFKKTIASKDLFANCLNKENPHNILNPYLSRDLP